MNVHKNARLTARGREAMVRRVIEGGQTPRAISEAVGVCPRTVRKWVKRYRVEGCKIARNADPAFTISENIDLVVKDRYLVGSRFARHAPPS